MSAASMPAPAGRRPGRRAMVLAAFYFVLAAALVLVLGAGVEAGTETKFTLNLGSAPAIPLPAMVLPSAPVIYLMAGVAAFCGALQLTRAMGARWAILLSIVAVVFVFGFLTWAAAGKSMSLVGILQTTVYRAVPITFAALSGVLCERVGVVNIAIEGMLLSGAFVAAVVASATGNNWIGLGAAVIAGGLLAAVLAVLSIRYRVNQIIAGTVINIFAAGITAFLATRVLSENKDLNTPPRFDPILIPVLSDIPIIGPIFFSGSFFVYALFVLTGLIHFALFYTRYGLRARSVGEHPRAADTVGINVNFTRYRNVILGGMMAGLGGAYFTIGSTGSFEREMTGGRGFIGLAAMIFGGWTPIGAFLASLVFGFADALQSRLSILGSAVPSEFLLMIPYITTIVVVAGLVGRVRMPAADGTPYVKE
ncbi:MAG TPA: ABC transporter permease [Candidatus Limnocylindrales bacterium]|nr:ABC transporter permease [Candidatus Limnocylindrales bacterium]